MIKILMLDDNDRTDFSLKFDLEVDVTSFKPDVRSPIEQAHLVLFKGDTETIVIKSRYEEPYCREVLGDMIKDVQFKNPEKVVRSSIVRRNLMTIAHYMPYCGDDNCRYEMPRTTFNGKQFVCQCGWSSSIEDDFINEYKEKWDIK